MRRREYTPFGGTSTVHLTAKKKNNILYISRFRNGWESDFWLLFSSLFTSEITHAKLSVYLYQAPSYTDIFYKKNSKRCIDIYPFSLLFSQSTHLSDSDAYITVGVIVLLKFLTRHSQAATRLWIGLFRTWETLARFFVFLSIPLTLFFVYM